MGSLGWMQSWPSFGGCCPQSRSEMERGAGAGQKGDREVTRCPCLQCRVQGWAVHGGGGGAGHTQCWGGRGCVQGWLGCVVELFSACVQHRESMCAHTRVHWSKAMQGVWESTCGSVWRDTGACPRRSCVCQEGVWPGSAVAVQWQCWPVPWHLLPTGAARLRQLRHTGGMWGLSCLLQTSQGGGMGELTNFL